jgi:hypothetical protein
MHRTYPQLSAQLLWMDRKIAESVPNSMTQINKCHRCGATSYKPVIKRDESGTMKPSGEHQCVGCKMVFTNIDEWRNGPAAKDDTHVPRSDLQ